jgi:alpha-galactosidase
MLIAEEKWLPQYKEAIAEAKKRLKSGNLIKIKENYQGASRIKVKTLEEMSQNREATRKIAAASDKGMNIEGKK